MIGPVVRILMDGVLRAGWVMGPAPCLRGHSGVLLALMIDREAADGIRQIEAMLRDDVNGR